VHIFEESHKIISEKLKRELKVLIGRHRIIRARCDRVQQVLFATPVLPALG